MSGQAQGKSSTGFVLTEVDGPRRGQDHYYDERAQIGRTEENDLMLVAQGVSRKHARIWVEHGVHLLLDLGSANGSRLNGEKVGRDPEVLRDGDYLTFGDLTLQFSLIEAQRGDPTAETRYEGDDVDAAARKKTGTGGRRRRLLAILAIALVVVLGWGAYKRCGGGGPISSGGDDSDEPVLYTDSDEFFGRVFGNGEWDRSHPSRLILEFTYTGGMVTLNYAASGVDKVGELTVILNGESIGEVPLTMSGWRYGLSMKLPKDKLKKENQLIFENTLNPPGDDTWQVCYIRIVQEAIPPADVQEATYQFRLAKQLWDDRGVETGNMYRALLGFRKARKYLEGLAQKPVLYREIEELIATIDGALTKIFQNALFSARRAERVGRGSAEALSALSDALRHFTDKNDFRYRELKRYVDALSE